MRSTLGLLLAFAAASSARPTPWSEDLLDEINALRAKGMTDQDIQFQHPVSITVSDRNQPIVHTSTMVATSAPVPDAFLPTSMDGDESGALMKWVTLLCKKVPFAHGHGREAATAEALKGRNTAGKDDSKSKKQDRQAQHVETPKLKNGVGQRGEEM